jgi:hypothetical protein
MIVEVLAFDSFAFRFVLLFSGGRLITVAGMYFGSARSIHVELSSGKWKEKLAVR